MKFKNLIKYLIGTDKVHVTDTLIDARKDAVIIYVYPFKSEKCRCGICHSKCPKYDNGDGERLWRTDDFGLKKCYIKAPSPRVKCPFHGVVTAYVPWARHDSDYTSLFEDKVTWLSVYSTKRVVSNLMRIAWHTVGSICDRVYKELDKNPTSRFDGLVRIGIDEKSYTKGHNYITVVINHDTRHVIWCHIGHDSNTLDKFFQLLTPEQKESIKVISSDAAIWIQKSVSENCPHARRCLDPFHVVKWATDALNKVRRRIYAEAQKSEKQRFKSEKSGIKPKDLKGMRYALLKNPDNLSHKQEQQLKFIAETNPVLYRAYLLKENLRLAITADFKEIRFLLMKWMSWAQRSRIQEMRKLRQTIKDNLEAIIDSKRYDLSNARVEAINHNIDILINKSYGFRNVDNLCSMIMLTQSDICPMLPWMV